jgi:hypothetical protein
MRTSKIIIALAVLTATLFVSSCKKEEVPLEKCVYALVDYRNYLENIYFSQTNLDAESFEAFNSAPKSINVPTSSLVRIITGWNFENYKDPSVDVSKIYIKTVYNGVERECELIDELNDKLKTKYFPAYANATYYVRFVLSNGEEATVGPFNVNVNADNKVLSHTSYGGMLSNPYSSIICTDNNSDKVGYFYLFSPYSVLSTQAGGLYKADLDDQFNKNSESQKSAAFGLFALTRQGLSPGQVKIVAADQIQSNGLYPELVSMYGCDLGLNYARFEPWAVSLDTINYTLQGAFENLTNSLTYSDLDAISFTNPTPTLVVSKNQPAFKFITTAGKKGYGVISYGEKACAVFYYMQR